MELIVESCRGCTYYIQLDLHIVFDQRSLDEQSRDLTMFQTLLGTFCLTVLLIGYTNSVQILYNDLVFILCNKILDVTNLYTDNVLVIGPYSRYEKVDRMEETLSKNKGIQKFVYKYLMDVNWILQRVKAVGGTFSRKKMMLCNKSTIFIKYKLTYLGRETEESQIQKVRDWLPCKSVTEVRGFLRTVGVLHVFI
ncbi:uncharacterized protein FOMMEDRAFT_92934 [Fomitiporia mediterranea MF3/22]|uniref:uncharacterized protein n=1 Tax=Fomitiporia mediterranea (strain MF3/22) TaxID=694068 RepID=UPI0004407B5A|nr:uncharacterized protein FOMMEDRAFT_92934 [Fomitiporia mediterranea MF3/22]EJC99894.1 hypothetical protein FOMMEDRAFT_92934 [Fomitiporia mediterranea MF3/22]